MRRLLFFILLTVLGAATCGGVTMAGPEGFRVIVHANNPVTTLSRSDLSKLFLKTKLEWPHGAPAIPVDLQADSEIRNVFTREVHDRSIRAVDWYWRRQMFSGGGQPPGQVLSEQQMVQYIGANPGAVGYVSNDVDMSRFTVKEIWVTD